MKKSDVKEHFDGSEIAVIGMSGRFPGARNVDAFWNNLRNGVEPVTVFTDEQLKASGVNPEVLDTANYVKARPVLEDIELFDAAFFGFSPREAELMDPQHRLFLECVWEAIENAGYDSENYEGAISVYAGATLSTYLINNIIPNLRDKTIVGEMPTLLSNMPDSLTTLIAYKLNLKGACYSVQTFCSTSLVAVHMACQSLLNFECDMAVAGGVSVVVPQYTGYEYREGGILSPDGHCRPFDAKAQGTIFGNGLGVVVLKRLDDALTDGDHIEAVIKGTATNNDGSLKVSYAAPSVSGQAKVIVDAMANAGVEPETITYVETHGTGTKLGDPVEVTALTQAFRSGTQKKGFCAIGSVKSNIGHLDAAAGVVGLIKTILVIKHRELPASLHFETPNPEIDFANSPFYVNSKLSEWKSDGSPRRAGVSSFGIGGTNAHVVVQEAPVVEPSSASRPYQLLVLSAKTSPALEVATNNLLNCFKQKPQLKPADVAYTLQVGRKAFNHRRAIVCKDVNDALLTLEAADPKRMLTVFQDRRDPPVAFMFSGQGSQYVNMGLELYKTEPKFKEQIDHCSEIIQHHLGLDLREILYPDQQNAEEAARKLKQTAITQPALFTFEYALAKLWMAWGVHPETMVGHSIGEYVAACLAGVFSLEEALVLVATRGRLMQELPSGSMLAVPLSEAEILPYLGENLSLAAINGPSLCVISGEKEAIQNLEKQLSNKNVTRLNTSHAFHSNMMEPILAAFTGYVEHVRLNPPQIPFVSNVTGTWITSDEATNPEYWAKHLRHTVRFADCVQELLKEPSRVLLEVGPGHTLNILARQYSDKTKQSSVLSSTRHPNEQKSDTAFILTTLGQLWLSGIEPDWTRFYAAEKRHRLPLPTYPFERQRFWIEPNERSSKVVPRRGSSGKIPDIENWFYTPIWKQAHISPLHDPQAGKDQTRCWIVFLDELDLGSKIVKRLKQGGDEVISVSVGNRFNKVSESAYTINPYTRDDYSALLTDLNALNKSTANVVHLWSLTENDDNQSGPDVFEKSQGLGFYSLLFLAQAFGEQPGTEPVQIEIISNNLQDITGEESLSPTKATVLGPCKVIPKEYPHISCRSIDIIFPESGGSPKEQVADLLIEEFRIDGSDSVVAYRGRKRWVQIFEPVRLNGQADGNTRLREGGVYLITGGMGGIGLELADFLAHTVQAKLILVGRSPFPPRQEWDKRLTADDVQDSIKRKITKVQALEKLGSEVMVVSADVTNIEQMREVVTQAVKRFGEINGIIHGAGVLHDGVVQLKTIEAAADVFAPKIKGTLVLEKLFQNMKLDFFVFLSSLSSVVGTIGQVDYCAANAFLDAFAHKNASKNGTYTVSINWPGWQEVGMAANMTLPNSLKSQQEEELAKTGILPREGLDAFNRILGSALPQVVVSTVDLGTWNDRRIKLEEINNKFGPKKAESVASHTRPNPPNDYVVPGIAPQNTLELQLAEIWEEILGIHSIGVQDDFFALGGHSLLAIRLFSQIEQKLGANLSLATIFQAPTIEQQANLLRDQG